MTLKENLRAAKFFVLGILQRIKENARKIWRGLGVYSGVSVVVLALVCLGLFFNWLNGLQEKTDAKNLAELTEICQNGTLGQPVERNIMGSYIQYFCMEEDGKLSRVHLENQNSFEYMGEGEEEKNKLWLKNGQEACQKAGLKNPVYLSSFGFFCETEDGEIVPVYHPDEDTRQLQR